MSTRALHHKLLLSTAALIGALSGYGRGAYGQAVGGACTNSGGSTYSCSGDYGLPQSITANNATVTVITNGLRVDTSGGSPGNAVTITGAGAMSIHDPYDAPNSLLKAGAGFDALAITSTGNSGADGSITVELSGDLAGGEHGIHAQNNGAGSMDIKAYGTVTGKTSGVVGDGISARNGTNTASAGANMSVTTGTGTIKGRTGINALNYGTGTTTVTTNGDVDGGDARGILARTYGNGVSVTTAANTTVIGRSAGIGARTRGGVVDVKAYGDVTATSAGVSRGIYADNGLTGTDINVTTGVDATVLGGEFGIYARAVGAGTVTIIADGDVTGTDDAGIYVYTHSLGSTDVSVTTGAGKTVTGGDFGIGVVGNGSGPVTIETNGDVTATGASGNAINIQNDASGTDISMTTAAGTTVMGGGDGINAVNSGSGTLTITASGDVTGTGNDGIYARHTGGGPIDITIGSDSIVTSNGVGADHFAIDIEDGPGDVTLAGTLNGGAGGAIRFDQALVADNRLELVSGAIINGDVLGGAGNDNLVLSGPGTGSLDISQIQNFETASKDGASHWTLTGTNTSITDFAVNDGVLSVNAEMANTAFTVNGGMLKGTGTFGALTVGNGGIVAPGNSIGTLTVNGAFTLSAGAIYEVEVNAAGQNDKVIVKGTVNLTGATLQVLAANGDYNETTDYVIIDNDGTDAVSGTFAAITTSLAFLTPVINYAGGSGNDVVLTLERNGFEFTDVAETRNQKAVAGALDQFPTSNALYLAVLDQTADGARQAFDALSGEVHATVSGVLADDSRYVRDAIMGRLMQAGHGDSSLGAGGPQVASFDSRAMALGYDGKSLGEDVLSPETGLAFWTRAYGAWGDYDGNNNAATADRDLGGFVSGMDAGIGGGWRVGLATGASFSSIDVNDRSSSADVETYHLGGYVGGMTGAFALRGGGMWAWNDIDTSRAVIFPGFYERQKASYDADTGQIFGEVAYPMAMGAMAVEPFGALAYVSVDTDTFRERGGSLASLNGTDTGQNVGYSTLGFRAATTTEWGGMLVTPHFAIAWQHAFNDVTPDAALAFASTGIGFDVTGVPLAEDSALIDTGLDFALAANLSAGVSYSGQFGTGVQDNAVKGRFAWLF